MSCPSPKPLHVSGVQACTSKADTYSGSSVEGSWEAGKGRGLFLSFILLSILSFFYCVCVLLPIPKIKFQNQT